MARSTQISLLAFNFNRKSLQLPDECGSTISDHTKQHCRNKQSMITPEAWTPVIIIYVYNVCVYLQLPLDHINSVTLEWIVTGTTLAGLSKSLMIFLSLQNKIILPKLEAVVCESYGLLFTWSPLGHYLRELLVKKWYKAHIILRLNF